MTSNLTQNWQKTQQAQKQKKLVFQTNRISQYQGLFQALQFTISFAFYGYLFWLVILKAHPLVAHEGCKGFAI